jgi:hypothetical protein
MLTSVAHSPYTCLVPEPPDNFPAFLCPPASPNDLEIYHELDQLLLIYGIKWREIIHQALRYSLKGVPLRLPWPNDEEKKRNAALDIYAAGILMFQQIRQLGKFDQPELCKLFVILFRFY